MKLWAIRRNAREEGVESVLPSRRRYDARARSLARADGMPVVAHIPLMPTSSMVNSSTASGGMRHSPVDPEHPAPVGDISLDELWRGQFCNPAHADACPHPAQCVDVNAASLEALAFAAASRSASASALIAARLASSEDTDFAPAPPPAACSFCMAIRRSFCSGSRKVLPLCKPHCKATLNDNAYFTAHVLRHIASRRVGTDAVWNAPA